MQGLEEELGSAETEADGKSSLSEVPGRGRKETNRMVVGGHQQVK